MVAIGADEPPVGRDDVEGQDALAGEAVAAPEPAEPAADDVADDADVRRGAGEGREAVLGGRGGDVRPDGARLDAGDAAHRVDLDAAHGAGADEDHVLHVAERRGVVAGALHDDPQAVLAGEHHELRDVLRTRRLRDHRGTKIGGQVPALTRGVVALVGRGDELALEAIAEGLGGEGVRDEHGRNPLRRRDRPALRGSPQSGGGNRTSTEGSAPGVP